MKRRLRDSSNAATRGLKVVAEAGTDDCFDNKPVQGPFAAP